MSDTHPAGVVFADLPSERLSTLGLNGEVFRSKTAFKSDFTFEPPITLNGSLTPNRPVKIGAFSYFFGKRMRHVSIGRYCSIALDVRIGETNHPANWLSTSAVIYDPGHGRFDAYLREHLDASLHPQAPTWSVVEQTTIGNDVWIGHGCFIKSGVTVGDGAIIGAGSVVTRDIAPYTVVGGVPARLIKMRFSDTEIEHLLAARWWDYSLHQIMALGAPVTQPMACIDWLGENAAAGRIRPYLPTSITQVNIRQLAAEKDQASS